MKRICSWIFLAVALGVLTGCAGMSTSIFESTAVDPVSMPPDAGD